ncbi:MAG: hypothetical protein OXB94_09630 [Nitrospira sp.]|nr:hypothetical protein [Nitrospira sp.]
MSVSISYLRFIVITLSSLLLLSGCFRAAGPDVGVRALRDQAEKRSLDQAEHAFLRADYATAVVLLNRFLRTHPQSSLSPEARWWLARAYQKTGNPSSALEHFRFVAKTRRWNMYQTDARFRATQLEERLRGPAPSGSIRGILTALGSAPGNVDALISTSGEIEASVIVLDVPCPVGGMPQDNGQPFSFDAMRSAVRDLSSRGTTVYLGVTLRCLGHFARERTLEKWKDWAYDPPSGTLRRSSYFSLQFSGYQAFLEDWLEQLRDLPLTGLVLRNAVPVGVYDGFNPLALRLFAKEFGVAFDPVRMFNDDRTVLAADSESGVHLPAVFWKWAGWKARERLRIVQSLVQTLRVRLPHLEFGMTLQPEGITDPIRGMIDFAEDWVDVGRGPFDRFLMTIKEPESTLVRQTFQDSPAGVSASSGDAAPVAKLVQYLGKPDKVWAILPARGTHARTQSPILPETVGRIYDRRGVP